MTGISQRHVAALAALVHGIRPEWDEPGIAAAVRRLGDRPLPQVITAFTRGAQNPANDTPAAILHMNNRAWDSDWYPPCKIHPHNRGRRTDGECGGCYADRTAVDQPRRVTVGGHPMPASARHQLEQARRPDVTMEVPA